MKNSFLLSMIFVLSILNANAQKGGTIRHLGDELYVMGVSPSGEYVVGSGAFSKQGFRWTENDGMTLLNQDGSECTANAVSNNGIVVGQFYDENTLYYDYDGNPHPLFTGGYWIDGTWTGLGIREDLIPDEMSGTLAEGISIDGTMIGGSMYCPDWLLAPTRFADGEYEALEFPATGQGGRIQGMSVDGSVFCGWVAPNYSRLPAYWKNDELHIITMNGIALIGEAFDVSPNGRYVALTIGDNAAVYDIQEDDLILLEHREGAAGSMANSVTDDCVVIGYHQLGFAFERAGFIYTEKTGIMEINEYLLQAGISEAAGYDLACPIDISADGKRIVGFGATFNGFVIDIEEYLDGYYFPRDLQVEQPEFGKVNLTWKAAKSDTEHTFKGYNIYRNGTKINGSPVNATDYTDEIDVNGSYKYTVTAVWDDNAESIPTNVAKTNVGKLAVPVFDDFSSFSLDTYYWNTSGSSSARWNISEGVGLPEPAVSYMNPSGSYDESLTSAYIDATEAEELFLSFNIAFPTASNSPETDVMKLELHDGTQWREIAEYKPLFGEWGAFTPQKYDITDIAAGKTIAVRFRAIGNETSETMYWNIDNFNVCESKDALVLEKPLRFTAQKMDDGTVHLNWADPGEVATLKYFGEEYVVDGIGNEGRPFISAAKFEGADLAGYNGYQLVSISAFITSAVYSPATFKVAVFLGEDRIVEQEITDYEANTWNTFLLDNPITISKENTEPLIYGIEVVSHADGELPIGACERPIIDFDTWEYGYEGRCNLYSEDGGLSWGTLTEFELFYSSAVKANLVKTENSQPKERLYGYILYREGEYLMGVDEYSGSINLTAMNNYTDYKPLANDKACYAVSAFYTTQEESEKTTFCLGDVVSIENVEGDASAYNVFPSPASDYINVVGDFSEITIYDLVGRPVVQTSQSKINLRSLSSGVYIMNIKDKNGASVVKKIVKQ